MCIIDSVRFHNIMHGRCKGTITEIKQFQKRIINTLTKLGAYDAGGAIKRINSSEVVDETHIVDMDIWILLNKPIVIRGEFEFIEELFLENVLIVEHIGSPEDSDKTIAKMNSFMLEHNLRAVGSAYNHSMHKAEKGLSKDKMYFRIYLDVETDGTTSANKVL